MFYSQFILAKKGPLGTIWIAAHLERKLKKNQVADTDIGISVDSILSPEVPIALRLSSHLLLGVVKIYSRKVNYLFNDCSETLVKIKQAFHSSAVDLPPEQSTAPYHSITLPETFDFEDLEFPDSSFSYGNFVDHHVTTREQITLQDTLDDPVYLGSQFGLDERFGDGEASQAGFEFDEDLFADEDDRQEPNSAGGCIDRNVSAAAVDDVTDKNRTESMKNQTHIHTDANNEMNIHVDTEPSSGYSLQQQESNSQHIVPSVTEALENCYKEMRTPDLTEGAFSLATNKLVEQEKFMDGMPVCDAVDVPNAVPSAQHHLSFENVQSVNLVDASNFIKQTSMEMSVATTSWPSSAFVVPSSTTSTSPTKVAELTTLNASNQVSNDVLVSQSGSSLVCKDWTEVLKLGNTVDVQVGQHAPFHSQPNLTSQLNLDNIKHGLQSFPSNVSSHLIPGTHSEILSNVTGHDCALTKMPGVETGISQAPYTAFHERNQIVVSERDLFSGAENQQFTRATELHEVMHKLSTGDNSKVEDAQMNVNSGCGNQDYAQTTEFHDPMSNTVYRQDPGVFQQQNHNAKVYEQLCLLAASQNNSMIEDTQKLMVNTCAKEMHPQMKRLHESMLGTYPQEMHLCTTEQLNNIPHMQQNMDLMLSSKDYSQVEIQEPMTDISGEDHIATLQRHMTSSCVQPPVNVSGVENNRFSTSSCSADANAVTTSLACSGSSAVSPVDRMQGVSQVNFKDQISLPSSVSPMPALANVSSTGDATENPPSNFPSHSETQRNYYSEQTGSILQPCSSLQDPGKHTSVASGILPSQSDLHRKVIQSESCFKNISLVSTSTTSTSMSQPQISAMDGNPNALLVSELSNPAVSIPEYVASESQKENRTSSSEIPACETLRASANTVVMEAVDKDLNQTLSLEDRCTEGGKAASASPSDGTRKRNIVEITPVLREGLPSRRRPSISNKTMDYIPADDDVLASILGRTPTFKVKETPVETTSVKRRRLTPKATPLKRKALVDVAIVLHSDQIRQQLENTEDIRRARKKAPCTRTEIWTGDRESKGQQIFFEPLIPDMCSELLDLYDNVREIKLKQHWDIVTNGKSEGSQIENDFGSNRGAQLVESHGNINEKRHESGSYSLDDDHQLEVVSQLHQSTVHTNTADKVLGDDVYRMNSIVESERAASHLDSREGKQRGRWLETFEPGIHMEIFDPEQRKGEQHLHKPTAQEPQRVCADNDQSKVEETHSQFVTALNQRKGAEVHSYSEYTTEHVGPKMAHHDGDKNAETVSRETRISNDNSIVLNKAEEDRSSSRLHHIESSREHTCITRGEEDQRDSIQLHQAEAFTLHTDDAVSLKTSLTESGLQHHHLLEGRCNSGSLADSLENRGLLVPAESNKKSLEEYSASSTITEKENEPNPLLESQEAVRTEHPYALGKKSPVSNNDILSSQRSDMNVDVGNIYVLPTERIPYNERIMGEEPINVRNEGRQYVAPRESTESDVSEAWLDKGVVGLEPTINQSLKKLTKQEERKTKSFINNNEAQDAGMLYGARSTDFLVRDDDPHSELEDNGGEHSCRDSIQENNGWSARTRAVGKYLKSVYEHMDCNAYANSQKKLCLSDLLAGKTRKEAARMFFETLVLKTRDYVHVEQKASFGEISIFPKVNLMKSSL